MADPRIPSGEMGEFRDMLRQLLKRLDELEKPTGTQLSQTVKKIFALFESLDEQVANSIAANSYTKNEIDAKFTAVNTRTWPMNQITGMLPISQGGTGSGNAYNQDLATVTRRQAWVGENGTLGFALSTFKRKANVQEANLPVDALLGLPVQTFQYRTPDGDAPIQLSGWDLGFVAEDVKALGLESFLYLSPSGDLEGFSYERMKFVHHEALRRQASTIHHLEAEVADLRRLLTELSARTDVPAPKE
ncbi:hypothetical protein ACFSWE_08670 [Leucobacter albus]|uniref:Peptidase S74 domain-containing protein n=1 Tax=Leucobacter albus TaxID=272210 RepID=A0ABW3TPL9_9MICO